MLLQGYIRGGGKYEREGYIRGNIWGDKGGGEGHKTSELPLQTQLVLCFISEWRPSIEI